MEVDNERGGVLKGGKISREADMTTRSQLLARLKAGGWISGQILTYQLAISRTAIWKHICKLREEGYIIEASRKKGYCLQKASDLLIEPEIREGLRTAVLGQKEIICLKETESTNAYAKQMAVDGMPEGTLIVAEFQSRGRGRRGREWFSPPREGLYLTVILRPQIRPTEAPRLTLMTSVAVAEAIEDLTALPVRIKWPNDVLIRGKKVAGILTEIHTEMDAVNYVIMGIGINVNTAEESFPELIRDKATSLFLETGEMKSRVRLLQLCLERLEARYELFNSGRFDRIMDCWRQRSDIIGREIEVDMMNRRCRGVAVDVDADGVLILKDADGSLQRIFSGDVTVED
jgi:BirA family transcriptional regulator, biotin operon repressor / biotin---[acetyl-CoA-carboxylase] ligase